ncbi:MAG: molybdopterin molybdotransferase MoeA [Rhodobacteraceae bacterium]|nr:molybdopterin molybdotransferase MoeA [Paracoccaceae bacterium]
MTILQRVEGKGCGCERPSQKASLISVDEALARIARETRVISETENVPLAQASSRVLARSVRALGMVPPFDNAAMDGYAINTRALVGAGPWDLEVAGRIAAGQVAGRDMPSSVAIQIFTGAPLPAGADAVVMQEDIQRRADTIRLKRLVTPGSQIRRAGEDMTAGRILLPAGQALSAKDIAVCAAAGHATVCVTRRTRVVLLVTGDEVYQPGEARSSAGIWDVNTPMLSAAMATFDIEFCGAHAAADTHSALRAQVRELADGVDLIVTTGGISVGEEDHVKPALSDLGATITFSGVDLKPGKPVSFGHLRGAHWLGLPGNPLSAFVTWQLFGTALCGSLAAKESPGASRRHVVLSRDLHHMPGRCELRLARLTGFDGEGREVVNFPQATHSGRVAQLTEMDGLLLVPADADQLPCGALIEFQPF